MRVAPALATEPGQRVLSHVLPNAPIATVPAHALKKGDALGAVAASREHFSHIEERLAQGIFERTEHELEDVLQPPRLSSRQIPRSGSRR